MGYPFEREKRVQEFFKQIIHNNPWLLKQLNTVSFHLQNQRGTLLSVSQAGVSTTKNNFNRNDYQLKRRDLLEDIELRMLYEKEDEHKAEELFEFLSQSIIMNLRYNHSEMDQSVKGDEDRYRLIYQVTEKLYTFMEVRDVFREIIQTINKIYPAFSCQLLINENEVYDHLPIFPLELSIEETKMVAAEAFITGEIQFTQNKKTNDSKLYAPLNGRQGVYGILELEAELQAFQTNDIEFIKLLANAAGVALENAKLYQQSQRSIADLQLINQTSHKLNSNLRLKEIIAYMKGQIIESFHADEVAFINFKPSFSILSGSTTFFLTSECDAFIKSMTSKMVNKKDAIFSWDIQSDRDYPSIPYRSLMAVPMTQQDQLVGIIIVLHKEAYAFTFDAFKLLRSIVQHSTIAFVNAMLREELEHMVITDQLTKLHNRSYLDKRIERSMLNDKNGIFILIDIDNFKSVNDTYGHTVGDQVLIQVASAMRKNLRDCDVASRWGGEEFAIYLPNINRDLGVKMASRVVIKVKSESDPQVTVSCGMAYWSIEDLPASSEELFQRADRALYTAKNLGKNRVVCDFVSNYLIDEYIKSRSS